MVTISDVAAAASVSIKTVSRVLNNEPHVRETLRARVLWAAADMGYRPNQSARRLAGGKSYLLALLYNNPTPSYIAGIQEGAAQRCRDVGHHLVVEPLALAGESRLDVLDRLAGALRPDGVLLIPPLTEDRALLDRLDTLALRCVRIAGEKDMPSINLATPERRGGRDVVEHLIGLGHHRIGVITPPPEHLAALARVDGYRDAMRTHGLDVDERLIVPGAFTFQSGQAAARALLNQSAPPTAIFAANDEMALGAMIYALQSGRNVPADLSVAGFDDTPSSTTAWPSLTTVRQPLYEMGVRAVDLLTANARLSADALEFELVMRESTAQAPF